MEYVYAAMLLHKAGKEINEEALTNVLTAAGITADPVRVKALVASLSEVNIDEAIKAAPTMMAAAPAVAQAPAAPAAEQKAAAPEDKKKKAEEEKQKEEAALEGLGALFG
jgi:large subunit ribosomal protein L12